MTKKQLISLTLSLLFSGGTLANDFVTVTTTSRGEGTSYDVDTIEKIVFDDSVLNIISSDSEGTTYAIDEIKSIKFGQEDPSAVKTLTTDRASKITLFVSRDGNSLIVNGWDSADVACLKIFGINGTLMLRNDQWRGPNADISTLPSGIYVVQIGKITGKIQK